MTLKKLTFSFLLLSVMHLLCAQTVFSVSVSAEKKKILLGEPLQMIIEVKFPQKSGTRFLMPDSINHFEYLEEPVIDSSNENGIAILKGKYIITSFDSGHWVIPSYSLSKTVKSDTIGIDVVFSDFNPEQPYHDIKDIIEVQSEKKKQWWWYAAGAGALLALVLIYFFKKRKPASEVTIAGRLGPYEEAMKELEQLRKTKKDSKQYYSKLTDIFRLYIFRKKQILSLQKTTDDLIMQLKNLGLPKEEFEKLSQVLRLSDFVKFAKYNPTEEDDNRSYNDILNSIKTIEQSGS